MPGQNPSDPLIVGDAVPISAFSPIESLFQLFQRDFRGIIVPLFAAAVVANLDTLLLGFGLGSALGWPIVLALLALWFPIASWCVVGMLGFTLRVARCQPYAAHHLWTERRGVLRLSVLKLAVYVTIPLLCYAPAALLKERSPGTSQLVAFAGFGAWLLLALFAASRLCLAPVVLVDRGVGAWRALCDSARLTRGNGGRIFVYWVVLSMIGGMTETIAGMAVLSTLATPGIVYLYLSLRGESA